ncbi:MAG: NAD(P)-dependent oxidoreductase [Endozoicomonas sp.]|uniref:NAD(P)-dependent oxidoreductase n=1 Tax=Endozoicomonas sp. TaxID=1892382 RepID=UPI003D9AFFA9
MTLFETLQHVVERSFSIREYPCLLEQLKRFEKEKPFAGMRLLYAAPLTQNTQVALLPVVAGGAELTLSWPEIIEADPEVVALFQSKGVRCYEKVPDVLSFDVILDCCGEHADLEARYGYVELTRSGLSYYHSLSGRPCLDVDSTLIKNLETVLGTGDGLLRAMKQSGFEDLKNKKVLLFGYGKVGVGISRAMVSEQARLTVVELRDKPVDSAIAEWIKADDTKSVLAAVAEADFIITATGLSGVIEKYYPLQAFLKSKAVLINMGAEDEYGESVPGQSVANQKAAFNFILEEPTQMKFIDPVFALYNECASLLISQSWAEGIRRPPEVLVQSLVDTFCRDQGYSRTDFEIR